MHPLFCFVLCVQGWQGGGGGGYQPGFGGYSGGGPPPGAPPVPGNDTFEAAAAGGAFRDRSNDVCYKCNGAGHWSSQVRPSQKGGRAGGVCLSRVWLVASSIFAVSVGLIGSVGLT